MIVTLIIIAIITIAAVSYLVRANRQRQALEQQLLSTDNKVQITAPDGSTTNAHEQAPDLSCCGAHEVCEAETLLTLTDKIVYYDDEELDAHRGTQPDDYSPSAIEEFRDVLLTLPQHEVAGWLVSLGLRGVTPPTEIREEALMIVSDFREQRMAAAAKSHK